MGLRRSLLRIAKGIVIVAMLIGTSTVSIGNVEAVPLLRSAGVVAQSVEMSARADGLLIDDLHDGPVLWSAKSHTRLKNAWDSAAGRPTGLAINQDGKGIPGAEPDSSPDKQSAHVSEPDRQLAQFSSSSGAVVQRVYYQYLPIMVKQMGPDLVIEDLAAEADWIEVLITNEGDSPVTHEFWVDAYIDPTTPPTHVNQTWEMLGERGVVWGVTADLLPIPPGESLTLTVGDAHYWPSLSNFPEPLASGTPVYIQVDSVNAETTYGNVLESHEIQGGAYNNIGKILSYPEGLLVASPAIANPIENPSGLPSRP